mmetsp:Transcript_43577/g.85336  ORF Transcript_43577/g.85336 Transcript_43577/m.85336 type:complete len:87 (-) Transcript_43577:339-599(-)
MIAGQSLSAVQVKANCEPVIAKSWCMIGGCKIHAHGFPEEIPKRSALLSKLVKSFNPTLHRQRFTKFSAAQSQPSCSSRKELMGGL